MTRSREVLERNVPVVRRAIKLILRQSQWGDFTKKKINSLYSLQITDAIQGVTLRNQFMRRMKNVITLLISHTVVKVVKNQL